MKIGLQNSVGTLSHEHTQTNDLYRTVNSTQFLVSTKILHFSQNIN